MMITAEDLNLDINTSFVGITSSDHPQYILDFSLPTNGIVILKKDKITISVHKILKLPDGSITGEVVSVESPDGTEIPGVGEDTPIMFSEKYIFAFSTRSKG